MSANPFAYSPGWYRTAALDNQRALSQVQGRARNTDAGVSAGEASEHQPVGRCTGQGRALNTDAGVSAGEASEHRPIGRRDRPMGGCANGFADRKHDWEIRRKTCQLALLCRMSQRWEAEKHDEDRSSANMTSEMSMIRWL